MPGCEEDPWVIGHVVLPWGSPRVTWGWVRGDMGAPSSAWVVRGEGHGTWGTKTWAQLLPLPLMGCVVFGQLSVLPKPQPSLPIGRRSERKLYLARESHSVGSGHRSHCESSGTMPLNRCIQDVPLEADVSKAAVGSPYPKRYAKGWGQAPEDPTLLYVAQLLC